MLWYGYVPRIEAIVVVPLFDSDTHPDDPRPCPVAVGPGGPVPRCLPRLGFRHSGAHVRLAGRLFGPHRAPAVPHFLRPKSGRRRDRRHARRRARDRASTHGTSFFPVPRWLWSSPFLASTTSAAANASSPTWPELHPTYSPTFKTPTMSDTVIAAEKVTKRYLIGEAEQRHETLIGSLISALMSPIRNARKIARLDASRVAADATNILWALDGVSFEVKRGEVLGIIGRNGAGKSTLLKILSRITEPTSGWVGIKGRVASLLEVGTGFHPELTGRDNVYMNGTLLGMTKREIDRKFDEIVDFSGVERFLDTPVKRYSSGMSVRLAFAVAAHLEPDILIVDEVLAVGDYEFQKKCMSKMEDVSGGRRSDHPVRKPQHRCNFKLNGQVHLSQKRTHSMPGTRPSKLYMLISIRAMSPGHPGRPRSVDQPLQFLSAEIRNSEGEITSNLDNLEEIRVNVEYEVRQELRGSVVAAILHARDGTLLFSTEDTDTQDLI